MAQDHSPLLDKQSMSDWMASLEPNGIGKRSMLQILLPGTHDSATSSISDTQSYAPNAPPILRYTHRWLPRQALKGLVCRWAIAQERTILQQLEDGIRYFDFRICSMPNTQELYTCHSVISDALSDILRDVVAFVEAHPREVLILNFNHFYCTTEEHHQRLATQLHDLFGNRMVPQSVSIHAPLEQLWELNHSLFVIYDHPMAFEVPYLWPRNLIRCAWQNAPTATILRNRIALDLKARKEAMDEGRDSPYPYRDIFHVTEGIVTPDVKMIVASAFGSRRHTSLTDLGQRVTPAFIEWLRNDWLDYRPNIVIVDHYHCSDLMLLVREANQLR